MSSSRSSSVTIISSWACKQLGGVNLFPGVRLRVPGGLVVLSFLGVARLCFVGGGGHKRYMRVVEGDGGDDVVVLPSMPGVCEQRPKKATTMFDLKPRNRKRPKWDWNPHTLCLPLLAKNNALSIRPLGPCVSYYCRKMNEPPPGVESGTFRLQV